MSAANIPSLSQRIFPLIVLGSVISAIRLILDFVAPDWPLTMHFGVYYLLPLVIIYIGLTRRWGRISWGQMALSMLLVGFLVWGIWNSIAYTTGQFMDWSHGRFYPGELVTAEDGNEVWEGGAAAPLQDTALLKVGAGLISSLTGSIWCIGFGSVFLWVPTRLGVGSQVQRP